MGWASQEQLAGEGSLKTRGLSCQFQARLAKEAEAKKVDGVDLGCQRLFLGHSKDQEGDIDCVHGVACHAKGKSEMRTPTRYQESRAI